MKKAMKKVVSLALGSVTALSCLAAVGCGGKKIDPNALVIEYYKAGYGEAWIKNLAAEYTSRTGKEVVLLPREGAQGLSKMSGSLRSGTAETDLFFADAPDFGDIYRGSVSAGGKIYDSWFADITDVYTSTIEGEGVTVEEKMYPYFQQYMKMPKENGKYYSESYFFFPYAIGMFGFVVNVNVWNAMVGSDKGYPRTTDELIEVCDNVKSKIAPFLYSVSEEYWTASLPVFMHQYEGDASMDNFYKGYGPSGIRYDTNMVAYEGYRQALGFFEELLAPANQYMHPKCASYSFTQMQGLFLSGKSLFCTNGDWLENEMIVNYPNANIEMMKTPVLSAVADKCSFATASNRDAILRQVIDYVDGETDVLPAECNEDDLAIVREARSVEYMTGNNNAAFIPSYSNQIDAAKDFLRLMASDEGMKLFRDGTNGCELPLNYTNEANKVNSKASVFRKSINEILAVSEARFSNAKDKIYSVGGINVLLYNNSYGRFVDAFKDNKATAQQYYDAEVTMVNSMLKGAKEQANIK